MSTFGIVCEFNPLHNGHKRLIDKARDLGAECIVCVMSGNAVQRGELAIADKYVRAEAAILCGADLVLELPYPWCAASAEYFSAAGIEILSHFCDSVIFGSESGDIDLLTNAAKVAATLKFKQEFLQRSVEGEGAAKAYFSLLERYASSQKLSSNDLLGIEYIRTAIEKNFNIDFYTIKREGAGYNDMELSLGQNPSATAIRQAWNKGMDASEYIPPEARDVFLNADFSGCEEFFRAVLMYFRLADSKHFDGIAEIDGGIENRIISCANKASSKEEFFDMLKTKRYTDAKLRRAMLFCMTGVRRELLKQSPAYVNLLGANSIGRELLSKTRKSAKITIVTKPADAPQVSEQFKVGERLESIFALSFEKGKSTQDWSQKRAFIKS